jgi:hypothetical protein
MTCREPAPPSPFAPRSSLAVRTPKRGCPEAMPARDIGGCDMVSRHGWQGDLPWHVLARYFLPQTTKVRVMRLFVQAAATLVSVALISLPATAEAKHRYFADVSPVVNYFHRCLGIGWSDGYHAVGSPASWSPPPRRATDWHAPFTPTVPYWLINPAPRPTRTWSQASSPFNAPARSFTIPSNQQPVPTRQPPSVFVRE